MKNLAGRADANAVFAAELYECGIPCEPVPPPAHRPEVDVSIQGHALIRSGFALRVERRWLYACAYITPRLPVDLAVNLASSHYSGGGLTAYSTDNGLLGGVARAEGYAGGLFGDHLVQYVPEGVEFWHVDSIAALRALVARLCDITEQAGINAEMAARRERVAVTERWIRECSPAICAGGFLGMTVRENLHENPNIDPNDQRIIDLRTKYPLPVKTAP